MVVTVLLETYTQTAGSFYCCRDSAGLRVCVSAYATPQLLMLVFAQGWQTGSMGFTSSGRNGRVRPAAGLVQ